MYTSCESRLCHSSNVRLTAGCSGSHFQFVIKSLCFDAAWRVSAHYGLQSNLISVAATHIPVVTANKSMTSCLKLICWGNLTVEKNTNN